MRTGGGTSATEDTMAESRRLGDVEADLARQTEDVERDLRDVLLRIPNIPAADAPDGKSEHDNVVVATVGYDPERYGEHQRVPHWEIGASLGILDVERA